MATSLECFRDKTRSNEYFQALEECVVYSLSHNEYKKTCEQFPEFMNYILLLMGRNHLLTEECLKIIKTLNPHGRYA